MKKYLSITYLPATLGLIVLLMGLAFWLGSRQGPVQIVQLPSVPGVTNLQVDAREITPSVIETIITDPTQKAEIDRLLAENKRLKLQVSQLTVAVAVSKSTGGGTMTAVNREDVPPTLRPDEPATDPLTSNILPFYQFKDWRLEFISNGAAAKYELNQQFEVITTTGRNKDGQPLALVTVSEIGEKGERLPLEVKSTNIFADQTKPHWSVGHLNLQAGAGMILMDGGITETSRGFMISSQWLRRGRTPAAEDSSVAILSPVAFVSDTVKEIGVFPISVNLGQIPKTPFSDMWISPYVGIYSGKVTTMPNLSSLRFGVGLTTTF